MGESDKLGGPRARARPFPTPRENSRRRDIRRSLRARIARVSFVPSFLSFFRVPCSGDARSNAGDATEARVDGGKTTIVTNVRAARAQGTLEQRKRGKRQNRRTSRRYAARTRDGRLLPRIRGVSGARSRESRRWRRRWSDLETRLPLLLLLLRYADSTRAKIVVLLACTASESRASYTSRWRHSRR